MDKKPKIFNIKGLSEDLQAQFRTLATQSGKTHSKLMSDLISGKTVIESTGKTEELNLVIEELNKQIEGLMSQAKIDIKTLHDQIKSLENDLLTRQSRIDELEHRPQGVVLTGHQYVFEPAAIQRNMQRCISQMIRKGKLNRHEPNLLQTFTEKAITYFIKNEYPEVL